MDGLVAVTRTLTPEMLLAAYQQGIFPWTDNPVRWFSPDPRAVILPDTVHLPRNLRKLARRGGFSVSYDSAFAEVMQACAAAHQADGVWITPRFIDAYTELHALGHAHSVEVWQEDTLVGGLYGVQSAGLFAGESMFHRASNASKVAFASLLRRLADMGTVLLDAQVINDHTASLGAVLVRRKDYLSMLANAMRAPRTHDGKRWPTERLPIE